MMDPMTVIVASSHIRNGLLIESIISAASLTSGRDMNDESQIAINMSPGAPQGSSVFNSHCERLLKYDISKPSSLTYPFQHKIRREDPMRLLLMFLAMALVLGATPQ